MSSQLSLLDSVPVKKSEVNETEIKRNTLKRFEVLRKAEIDRLRRSIRHLCHSNTKGQRNNVPHSVTSDDLREYEGITREHRAKRGRWFVARNAIIGAAFHYSELVNIGTLRSKAEGRHSSKITLWTLRQYENSVKSFVEASGQ